MLSEQQLQSLAPFPVVWVPGAKVSETWDELRQRPGIVPLMLGSPASAAILLSLAHMGPDTAESVARRAARLDVDSWMAERRRANPKLYDLADVNSPWDGARRPIKPFIPAYDHRGDPLPDVVFALVPAEVPWMVPFQMRFPGVGNCPHAAVHAVLFRRWYERCGAVVCTAADGVVEFQLPKPIATLEAARQTALEHFFYCPDVVHQLVVSIPNLAAALMENTTWYFWWEVDPAELQSMGDAQAASRA
jgi:hypothetical protein